MISVILAAAIFFFRKRDPSSILKGDGLVVKKEWLVQKKSPVTPAKDVRSTDQTFLTFPEWYLVFSPEEQADYFQQHTSTTFPFMSHTAQIWQGYKAVNNQVKDNFPRNNGYHNMILVIGTSASVEYSIKAWYETVIGRITDTHDVVTEEDKFNAKFTREYVDFIKDRPWYEFDFKKRLGELWSSTSFFGDHFIRKVERKYILTSELLVKWIYGKLIGLGTKVTYDEALPTTAVLLDSLPNGKLPGVLVQKFPDNSALVSIPRYDKFNAAISALAESGAGFKEIAGNDGAILVTIIVPSGGNENFGDAQEIFRQPFSSNPAKQRIALAVPVPQLNQLILLLHRKKIIIEHIFDY